MNTQHPSTALSNAQQSIADFIQAKLNELSVQYSEQLEQFSTIEQKMNETKNSIVEYEQTLATLISPKVAAATQQEDATVVPLSDIVIKAPQKESAINMADYNKNPAQFLTDIIMSHGRFMRKKDVLASLDGILTAKEIQTIKFNFTRTIRQTNLLVISLGNLPINYCYGSIEWLNAEGRIKKEHAPEIPKYKKLPVHIKSSHNVEKPAMESVTDEVVKASPTTVFEEKPTNSRKSPVTDAHILDIIKNANRFLHAREVYLALVDKGILAYKNRNGYEPILMRLKTTLERLGLVAANYAAGTQPTGTLFFGLPSWVIKNGEITNVAQLHKPDGIMYPFVKNLAPAYLVTTNKVAQ